MNTKQKIILLDLDGTVTNQSTWLLLNKAMGITEEQDETLFKLYRKGELSYLDWIDELMKLYRSNNSLLSREQLLQIAENVELVPDAKKFITHAVSNEYRVILVSGSVDILVEHIAKRLGIEDSLACSKAIFENNLLANIQAMGDESLAKVKLVEVASIKLSKDIISVGDGGNDIELFKTTKGILVGDNKALLPHSWKQVNNLADAIDLI